MTIEKGATVFHTDDLTAPVSVSDVRGEYATLEWLDEHGLPRRRVVRRTELVAGSAGRMFAPSPPLVAREPGPRSEHLIIAGLFCDGPESEKP